MSSEFLKDLIQHKQWVAEYMQLVANNLFKRAAIHDNSKFESVEFGPYDKAFPEFKKYAFGSPEMKAVYESIQSALQHHYEQNRHHPEHFENGINDMHLVDVLEMVCDWLAASKRSQTGIEKGLEINKERYGIDDQLFQVISNTVHAILTEEEV